MPLESRDSDPLGQLLQNLSKMGICHDACARKASAIIKKQQSRKTNLRSASNTEIWTFVSKMQAFQISSQGNFPYYWQDPNNLKFNRRTFDWISANLLANQQPLELQNAFFFNLYIEIFSKVTYQISAEDQKKLEQSKSNIEQKQSALIKQWVDTYGHVQSHPPIDAIINTITQSWANPATSFTALLKATNPTHLLNQVPPSGTAILPTLMVYLNSVIDSDLLTAQLHRPIVELKNALDAVQFPSLQNGGLKLDDHHIQPAFQVEESVNEIIRSLDSTDPAQTITIDFDVLQNAEDELEVIVDEQDRGLMPLSSFLNINTKDDHDLFLEHFSSDKHSTRVSITFKGVTIVHYGPIPYNSITRKYWYWSMPIQKAIANKNSKKTGYHFSIAPNTDFSKSGPFGYLSGVAISKNIEVKIHTQRPNVANISDELHKHDQLHLHFLNANIGATENLKAKNNLIKLNPDKQELDVTFQLDSANSNHRKDSTAFVLGVQSIYPGAH